MARKIIVNVDDGVYRRYEEYSEEEDIQAASLIAAYMLAKKAREFPTRDITVKIVVSEIDSDDDY